MSHWVFLTLVISYQKWMYTPSLLFGFKDSTKGDGGLGMSDFQVFVPASLLSHHIICYTWQLGHSNTAGQFSALLQADESRNVIVD